METRLRYLAGTLRSSYWFIPALMLSAAAVLAFVTVWVDRRLTPADMPVLQELVYTGGTDGAREVLSAISASMITVAGVVFSITIVTLQLASSQFGPRILANFMRDRANQVTLGTFVSTFLYSLLVLRTVSTEGANAVPHLSVTLAVMLAIASLSVLIFFIHHVSTTIQAPNLIQRITHDLQASVDTNLPAADDPDLPSAPAVSQIASDFDLRAREIRAPGTGYVQVINFDRLVHVAAEHDLVVRLLTRPGRFLDGHTAFALAYPADRMTEEAASQLRAAVGTGASRSQQHDVEFPIKQMVEIAVRALSPGINDPFTAGNCVDQLSAALSELAGRPMPPAEFTDKDGVARVHVREPLDFATLVGGMYDQIRQCASFHTIIYMQMLDGLVRVATCVRDASRLPPLLRQGELILAAAARSVADESDREDVRKRYHDLVHATAGA